MLTHSNHLGTYLDGEIHFFTPGKDIAALDLSDATGDYQIYTPQAIVPEAERSGMIEERVEVREEDILIIHTGYHHFGWDMPTADEIRYMVQHPGPDREFAVWAKEKKIKFSRSAWRFVDGESCIGRCVAMVDDDEYGELMARKAGLPRTKLGDGYDPGHVERINRLIALSLFSASDSASSQTASAT